jgi:hypothetical protein
VEIAAGLLRHPSSISIDGSEACEDFPYVFESFRWVAMDDPDLFSSSPPRDIDLCCRSRKCRATRNLLESAQSWSN